MSGALVRLGALLAVLAAFAPPAHAKLNRNYLVSAYEPCPGSGNCNPPTLSSAYTFDSIVLYSSPQRYTAPGKLALVLVVKGLRDPAGNLVTGTLTLDVGASRITILGVVGTLGETSPLAEVQPYRIDVTNGAARFRFFTPDATPERGLVVNSLGTPVLYDPDGKALATTGTQSKP